MIQHTDFLKPYTGDLVDFQEQMLKNLGTEFPDQDFEELLISGQVEISQVNLRTLSKIYPLMEIGQQIDLLVGIIRDVLDKENYIRVQNLIIPHIQDPLLMRDIQMNRYIYWIGFEDVKDLLDPTLDVEDFWTLF